ncbi:CBS domain-containing protein [Geomonas subterranea]|uniref:CBS domain-containing protein n=1 Tax=Geomonas subterranea TaxID=2847989 RepID=A0ABX8LL54_9BACT|nr:MULTISPECIES: CBS domain-containing protein [Geomonas]QXE91435.1 CBS domain-containing protein [Geomonas subterranea]QXM10477.1 CBS domain-containing protein [Geomonas subterranea]
MKAKDIMVTDVPSITTKTTVAEAVRIMKSNFGDESFLNAAPGLIVVNERGGLAGILTPLSIITAIMDGAPEGKSDPGFFGSLCDRIKDLPISAIMEHQPISVTQDASVSDVARLFLTHRFQRVPVVDGKKVVGIIYRSRLLFAISQSLQLAP